MAQKRSENTYQKINSIFYRDTNNIIMPHDEYVRPEFELLKNTLWAAEEKIDGTNIRIEVELSYTSIDILLGEGIKCKVSYKGKTDTANVPKQLMAYLQETFPENVVLEALGLKSHIPFDEFKDHKWVDSDGNPDMSKVPTKYTIYGEGYGAGIQSGGYYSKTPKFIGFDVKVGDLYLLKPNRDEILTKMGADIVPFIGLMTIEEAIEFVKPGFMSMRAEANPHKAEGLVLRSPLGLKDRMGNRLIFKVKTCDFDKYLAKYGTLDPVPQERNPKITGE